MTSGLTSDLAKVRAIFTWMGSRDIVNSADTYSSYPAPDSPELLMKNAAAGVNACFVSLFALLCRYCPPLFTSRPGRHPCPSQSTLVYAPM